MNCGCLFSSWTGFSRFARHFGQQITTLLETARSIFLGHMLNALQMYISGNGSVGFELGFVFQRAVLNVLRFLGCTSPLSLIFLSVIVSSSQ